MTSNEIDVALDVDAPDSDEIVAIRDCPWQDDSYVAAAADHPLRGAPDLSLADTLAEKWASLPKGTDRHAQLEQIFAEQGLPGIAVETGSITALKNLVADSGFLSRMATPMYQAERRAGLMATLPLHQVNALRRLAASRRGRGSLSGTSAKLMVKPIVDARGKIWLFVAADYAFGKALEGAAAEQVREAGGQVLGDLRHSISTADYSLFLLAAQSSGVNVIGSTSAVDDALNVICGFHVSRASSTAVVKRPAMGCRSNFRFGSGAAFPDARASGLKEIVSHQRADGRSMSLMGGKGALTEAGMDAERFGSLAEAHNSRPLRGIAIFRSFRRSQYAHGGGRHGRLRMRRRECQLFCRLA